MIFALYTSPFALFLHYQYSMYQQKSKDTVTVVLRSRRIITFAVLQYAAYYNHVSTLFTQVNRQTHHQHSIDPFAKRP